MLHFASIHECLFCIFQAVVRLGGQAYLQKCRDLKVANLDQQDKELLLEFRRHTLQLETLNSVVSDLTDPVPRNIRGY